MAIEDATADALAAAAKNNEAAAESAEAAALLAALGLGGGGSITIDTAMPDMPLNSHVPSTYLLKQELDKKLSAITFDDVPTEGSDNAITSDAIWRLLRPIDWNYSQRMENMTLLPGKYIWAIAQDNDGSGEARGGYRVGMSSQSGTKPWSKADYTDYESFGVSVYRGGTRTEFFQFCDFNGQTSDQNLVLRRKDLPTLTQTISSASTSSETPSAKAVYDYVRSAGTEVDLSEIKSLIGNLQSALANFAYGTGSVS